MGISAKFLNPLSRVWIVALSGLTLSLSSMGLAEPTIKKRAPSRGVSFQSYLANNAKYPALSGRLGRVQDAFNEVKRSAASTSPDPVSAPASFQQQPQSGFQPYQDPFRSGSNGGQLHAPGSTPNPTQNATPVPTSTPQNSSSSNPDLDLAPQPTSP